MNLMWIFIILCLIPILEASRCPGPEWTPRRGTSDCYFFQHPKPFISGTKTWRDAQKECQIRGGSLVDIQNTTDFDYIKSKLGKTPLLEIDYWTGLTYETGKWIWADADRDFVQGDMGTFNPNNVATFSSSTPSKKLAFRGFLRHDYDGVLKVGLYEPLFLAGGSKNFICKAKYSNRPLCKTEEGWDFSNGRCWLYPREILTWESAKRSCLANGGYIAVPSTEDENKRLKTAVDNMDATSGWLGIRFTKLPDTTATNVTWEDGTPLLTAPYRAPWYYGQTEALLTDTINGLASIRDYCGYLQYSMLGNAKWYLEASCSDLKPYACETSIERCPYGWDHFDDYCYQIRMSDDDIRPFSAASGECGRQGGHLVNVKNQTVVDFLQARIAAYGLTSYSRPYVWVGVDAVIACGYMMGSADGLSAPFNATVCTEELGFICQANYTSALQMDVVHQALKCDPPFKQYHDGCFLLVVQNSNWDAAQDYCRTRNASLVEIETGGENSYLREMISVSTWIGIRQISYEDSFGLTDSFMQYASGRNMTDLSYENFRYSSSGNHEKSCFHMLPRTSETIFGSNWGQWDADTCTAEKPFICHHRGTPFQQDDDMADLYTPECGEGWFLKDRFCYKLNFQRVNYALAAQMCQNEGTNTNLLYISSRVEEIFIRDLINGLNPNFTTPELGTTNSYWTALQIVAQDQWYWKYRNETSIWTIPLPFTHWAEEQPDPDMSYSAYNPKCVDMRANFGTQWEASSCTQIRASICKKPAALNQTIPLPDPSPLPINITLGCPKGWEKEGENCYHRNHTLVTWTTARDFCRDQGAYLASLVSATAFQNVKPLLEGAWIGLNSVRDPVDPRHFVNDDGTEAAYTPWQDQISRPGRPNGPADANCVSVVKNAIDTYSCGETRPFVCMMPLLAEHLIPSDCVKPPHDHGCQKWGYGLRSSCFYMGMDSSTSAFGSRKYVSFDEGRRMCRASFGGDLAVLNTQEKQEFMTSLLGNWAADYWVGLREDESPWNAFKKWINNASTTYTNWGHNEPHPDQGFLGCVALHGSRSDSDLPGDWYVSPCDKLKFAICEGPRDGWTPPTIGPTPFMTGCPLGWTTPDAESRNCYKAFYAPDASPGQVAVPMKLNWREAENSCIDFKGHLGSISTQSEQNYMINGLAMQRRSGYNYWIGLHEGTDFSWTGEAEWKWSDGTPYGTTATFWHQSTNHSSNLMDCVGIDAYSGRWIAQNCNLGWGWICEIPKGFYHEGDEVPTIPTPTGTNSTCATDFTGSGDWYYDSKSDRCFYISKAPASWDNAQRTCNSINANLASVSADQHSFLTTVLSRYGVLDTNFWIGLRLKDPVSKQHLWVDGSLSVFRMWDVNEPDPFGVEACVKMNNRNGKWKDDFCQKSQQYVCLASKTAVSPPPTLTPVDTSSWNCPPACVGCYQFRDFCYYFSPASELVNWTTAHDRCSRLYVNENQAASSSYLVSIHDSMEQDFITAHMGTNGGVPRWTGLREDVDKYTMYYSDHTPFDFSRWDWREPLYNPAEMECILLWGDRGRAGRWNDEVCSNPVSAFICKMKKDPQFPPTMPPVEPPKCRAGYEALGDACFGVRPLASGLASWENARDLCFQTDRARIATVTDIYENAFVHVLLAKAKNFVTSADNTKAWLGMQHKDGKLAWHSGCYPSFNNIKNFYADQVTQNQTCVAMDYNSEWRTQTCDTKSEFVVCESRTTPCAVAPVYTNGICPLGFPVECSNFCYDIQQTTSHGIAQGPKVNWNSAKQECIRKNASLVSIRNEEDQRCLDKYITNSAEPLWLGLYEEYDPQTRNYTWVWTDPEVLVQTGNYENWNINEPSTGNSQRESCTEIQAPLGKWNNIACYSTLGYICEIKKISTDVPTPSTPTSTSTVRSTFTTPTTHPSTASPVTHTAGTPASTAPHRPSDSTTSAQGVTGVTGGSTSATVEHGSTDSLEDQTKPDPEVPKDGSNVGTLAGIGVTICIVIPALTYIAYVFWSRRASPAAISSRNKTSTFKSGMRVDEEPVVGIDNDDDQFA